MAHLAHLAHLAHTWHTWHTWHNWHTWHTWHTWHICVRRSTLGIDSDRAYVRSPFVFRARTVSQRRAFDLALAGAMVVEVALLMAALIGAAFGFCLGKALSTTTRASKDSAAPSSNGDRNDCQEDPRASSTAIPDASPRNTTMANTHSSHALKLIKDADKGDESMQGHRDGRHREKDNDPHGTTHKRCTNVRANDDLGHVWVNPCGTVYHVWDDCRYVTSSAKRRPLRGLPNATTCCKTCSERGKRIVSDDRDSARTP